MTDAESFVADNSLTEEVFGAASLVIRCKDVAAMKALAEKLEGQLTATLQMESGDLEAVRDLLPMLEQTRAIDGRSGIFCSVVTVDRIVVGTLCWGV